MQLLHYGISPQKCVHLKETTHKRKRGRGVNGVQKRVHSSSYNRHSLLIIDSACVPFHELCCWIEENAARGGRLWYSTLPPWDGPWGRDSFQLYRSSTTHADGIAFSSTVHQRHTRTVQLSGLPFFNDTHGRDSFQLSSRTHTGGTAFSSTVHQRHTLSAVILSLVLFEAIPQHSSEVHANAATISHNSNGNSLLEPVLALVLSLLSEAATSS